MNKELKEAKEIMSDQIEKLLKRSQIEILELKTTEYWITEMKIYRLNNSSEEVEKEFVNLKIDQLKLSSLRCRKKKE